MLFALGQPVAFAGLLVAFLLALLLRAYAIRLTARSLGLTHRGDPVAPRLREDIDPFGAVAAAVGGAGWGRIIDVDEVPRGHGRGRAALIFLAGPGRRSSAGGGRPTGWRRRAAPGRARTR